MAKSLTKYPGPHWLGRPSVWPSSLQPSSQRRTCAGVNTTLVITNTNILSGWSIVSGGLLYRHNTLWLYYKHLFKALGSARWLHEDKLRRTSRLVSLQGQFTPLSMFRQFSCYTEDRTLYRGLDESSKL